MKFVASASEPEMVLAFLEAELNSPVWGRRIRELIGDTSLITSGDPRDAVQNEVRKTVLAETRGYGRNMWLFEGFPVDVDWVRLDASIGDLEAMRHMDYPSFRQLTSGSLVIGDGVANIDRVQASDNLNTRIRDTAAAVAAGLRPPPLIALATAPGDALRVMEGNTRAPAYVLALPRTDCVPVIAGYSAKASLWTWYGQPASP
jgi:hypothetical protein